MGHAGNTAMRSESPAFFPSSQLINSILVALNWDDLVPVNLFAEMPETLYGVRSQMCN